MQKFEEFEQKLNIKEEQDILQKHQRSTKENNIYIVVQEQ